MEPGGKPVEPGGKPVEPGGKPVEPGGKPVEPGGKPVEPGGRPVEPGGKPVEPGGKPVEPGGKPVEPGGKPVEPGGRPVEPGGKPVEPGVRPVEPVTPPLPPRPGFMPRIAEALGFKGGNLDAPSAGGIGGGSRGGGGGEMAPGGTRSAANEGAGAGGASSPAAKPVEAAAAKPAEGPAARSAETASKAPEKAPAPVETAKAPAAHEAAPSKSPAREAAPERAVDAAPELVAQAPRPLERVGTEAAPSRGGSVESSEFIGPAAGAGRGRPLIERGPVERAAIERGPVERAPIERAPAEGTREGAPEPGGRGESASLREPPAFEPSRAAAPKEGAPPETAALKPAAETTTGRAVERGPARAEGAPAESPGSRRESADAQREANALVEDGAAAAPQAMPGAVKRALAGADAAFGAAMKPVGALFNATAALAARAGQWKLPFSEVPLSRVVGSSIRGLQTMGLGVEAVGARLGFLGGPVRGFGMMLQGRVLPHEGRPLTFEEVWHPDLAKRPSFLEAASAEVRAKGGKVEGLFDPATGRASFGPKAKGSVEVSVEVRPDGRGGVEIADYQVRTADPALEARAHGEMYGQLERTFHTEQHQAGLDDFFADKAVTARLAENAKLTGETFLDVTYDAGARRFRLAEAGRGEARLRFEPEPSGDLRLIDARPLAEGARLPPGADYNLRMFSARRGVSLPAARLTPEELGAKLAERLKTERVRVEQENIVRSAMAESRVKDARAKLDEARGGAAALDAPALAKVRELARGVAELRIERDLSAAEIAAADKHLESLGISKKAVALGQEALGARERAGRDLDKAEAEYASAQAELNALAEGDAGLTAARERLRDARARGRETAGRFRVADENAALAGGGLTDSAVDALVRRQAASRKLAAIESSGRAAMGELRAAVREARGGKQSPAERKAAVRETLALERLAAAEAAQAQEGAIREYRRDGLHRSTGGDGRRLAMMRLLAEEGALPGGRASVGQEAGKNLCVLATAADMAAAAAGRPAAGAMAEAEAAIVAHHEAKAKAAGAADWKTVGREAGDAFLKDAARTGMSPAEMREMMGAVAEASGLRLVEIPAEKLFVELAAGRQVAVVMTHVADAATGFNGGAHMVNLSNWRQARNPLTGRVETMVDVADPNVRVLAGRDGAGAPVYEAKTVAMPLSQVVPEIRGSLRAENGRAAGYAFEPAGGAGPRGPPALPAAELVARMGGSPGVGAAETAARVEAPAGFDSRGPGKILDPNYLPVEIYSKEIMKAAREHGLVYELDDAALFRMKPGVKHNYVIVANPGGTIEMTVGRVADGNVLEVGIKHAALGDGRPVLFAGELVVDPVTRRPKLDLNSGTYSRVGLDRRWAPTPENARALAAHAEAILGRSVEVYDRLSGRPIELRGRADAVAQGVGSALAPVPDSAAAARLRAEQSFARTPDYPNSAVFTENSRKANDFFNRWLDGREGSMPLRQAMESMHKLYAGEGEIGKGKGGQYAPEGAPSNGRAQVTRDFVRDDFGLEPNPDGHVALPGIPEKMAPYFIGSRYFYPDSSIPGMRETYYKALETHLAAFSERVNRIEALKAKDPNFQSNPEYQALIDASLDAVVDFGRTAAAFRQFKNGNWGLYGPMMNSMVNRLGFSIKSPGYLDIILQGATEASIKPFFGKSLREGREFFTKDGFDPTKGKARVPAELPARAPSGPRDARANAPAVVKYEGPIRLRLGGEYGKTLEILSRADLARRFPAVERSLVDPRIEHVLIDPADPSQLKGLRPGQSFELGRASPGRFDLMQQVSGRHLRVTGNGGTLTIEDLGSRNGTRIEAASELQAPKPAQAQPFLAPRDGAVRLEFGGKSLEVLSRAELHHRFPGLERDMAPGLTHFVIDPLKPGEFKALRPGVAVELGRENPGRFQFGSGVAPKAARLTLRESGVYIEDLGGGLRVSRAAEARSEGVGSGFLSGLFGAREKTPSAPEKIAWPLETGGPAPARLDFGALRLDGPLKNLEAAHANVLAVEAGGRKAVLKIDAKPNEARVLAAMAEVPLPANVRVPRLLGDAPADAVVLARLADGSPGAVNYSAVKRAAAEGRHMIVVERLPDDFVSMMQVTNGSVKLQEPISRGDWQGLLDAVKAFSRRDIGFGDFGNETNIRLRQVPDGKGGSRTEFALIDAGQGTLKGKIEVLASDYVQIKGDRALETRLLERGLLEARGALPDPRRAATARNQSPLSRKFADELSALMKDAGERPSAAVRAESHRFTDLSQAASYLKAPEGLHLLEKTSEGLSGDTVKVEVAGEDWYLKRVTKALGESIDAGLRGLTPRERAGNELAMREIVRRWFPETFGVAPEAIAVEHGGEIFVLTKGAAAAPAPERLKTMTAAERADYALLRLVFRAEDLNRGNVLFGKDGKPTLIDFEKVIAEPLDPASVARGANSEIFVKGFPIVSLAGNDPAIYRAHADALRARFDDPNFTARLTEVLERAGWTPERRAAYLKSVEINLRNFETNLKPYLDEAAKTAAKRLEGVGSGSKLRGAGPAGAADGFFDGPPDAVIERTSADKPSPLRQMQVSLEARGKGGVFKEAEAIFYTDGLTGLPNRAFIMEKAEGLLAGVKEPTVAMLDMNNFGAVNAGLADVHGPVAGKEMGDGMLADAGPKINLVAKNTGVHAARLGGEEIVVFGAMNDVIEFASVMRRVFPPEQVLRDAKVGPKGEGIVPGGREHDAISAAMTRMQRTGPMGDFTYGLARTEGRSFDAALKAADGVLNKAKAEGLRGEAVMEVPGGGVSFTRLREISTLVQGVADHGVPPTPAARSNRLKAIADLKAKLNDKEYAVFLEAAFKDPLTLTKTAEWVDMARPQWEAAYEGSGSAAILSARNFKAVNDVLGHAAGDLYLKRLGVIARVEVNRLRKLGYSVEEPVRVGGKEFLLVGRDAAKAAELVGRKFVDKLNAGLVLPAEQLAHLRAEAPARGLIPKDRVSHIGDLRVVDEPFKGGFKKTYERLILELESIKGREDHAAVAPRPEGVGSAHEEIPGFLKKAPAEPRLEPEITAGRAPASGAPMSEARLAAHIMAFEMVPPENGHRYVPREIKGGGHTEKGLEQAIRLASESLAKKRAQFEADQLDLKAAKKRQDVRMVNKLTRTMDSGGDLPAPGKHWTERPDAVKRLPDYPNGVKRVVLPEDAYTSDAWKSMGEMKRWAPSYIQGGKTFFPEDWTAQDIRSAAEEVASHGKLDSESRQGRTMRGAATRHGQTISIDVSIDASGRTSTSYPSWNQ
ncbi:MAG: diguanylate cyclase [Elusimicrobia bacterium]|nr:diguanylate cyclase [Elusimicrobiota bacterium]